MDLEQLDKSSDTILWPRKAASLCILIQFIFLLLVFNFTNNIYLLSIGGVLLPVGLILIITSTHHQQILSDPNEESDSRLYNYISYPMHLGWTIVSISLALITQRWYSTLLAIGFVIVIAIEVRTKNTDS